MLYEVITNFETNETLQIFKGHSALIQHSHIISKHNLLITFGFDNRMIFWNLETGEKLINQTNSNNHYTFFFSSDYEFMMKKSYNFV